MEERIDFKFWLVFSVMVIVMLVVLAALPAEAQERNASMYDVYSTGQEIGRNPTAFMSIGDSNTYTSSHLKEMYVDRTEEIPTHLMYTFFDFEESFRRWGYTASAGWTTEHVLQHGEFPLHMYSPPESSPLIAEIEEHNPAFAFIAIGSNDVRELDVEEYRENVQFIVDTLLSNGVIPVIFTIPPQPLYKDVVAEFNLALIGVASRTDVHFINLHRLLCDKFDDCGLNDDGLHLSEEAHEYWNMIVLDTLASLQAKYTYGEDY